MKYYIIAGERSGDLHGANLVKAIHQEDAEAEIRAWGGDAIQAAGAELALHYRELGIMGFWEVFKSLFRLQKLFKFCKADIKAFQPDALILIDFGGFNMRMARFGKEAGIPVHYYIAPKVWAWNQKRALKIKRWVDQCYTILPFETEFFKKFDYDVHYVGNPLLDAVRDFEPDEEFFTANQLDQDKPVIAILPGSRTQEVKYMLSLMMAIQPKFSDCQFVIAGVDNLNAEIYQPAEAAGIRVIYNATYDLLHIAQAALVTSGTATLETALFEVPQVICYKTSVVSYAIARRLIKVKFIGLVNLILDKMLVEELIQDDLSVEKMQQALQALLPEGERRNRVKAGYKELKGILGNKKASQQTARLIYESLQ